MNQYHIELLSAIASTKNINITVPTFEINRGPLLFENIELCQFTIQFLDNFLYRRYSITEIAGKSIQRSIEYQDIISEILRCKILLTFGFVNYKGNPFFYAPKDKILENKSVQKNPVNLHCWYTLPTLEIIDLTLIGTFKNYDPGIFPNIPDYRYCVINRPESEMELLYHPQFVGNDFLAKIR